MLSTADKVLLLKGVELFSALAGEDLAGIALIAEEVAGEAGDALLREGEHGDALYFVVDGKVRVHRGGRTVAELGEREVFGEMALLDPGPRSASVDAVTDVTLLRIGRDDFFEIMAERAEVPAGVIKVLTRRLRATSRAPGL